MISLCLHATFRKRKIKIKKTCALHKKWKKTTDVSRPVIALKLYLSLSRQSRINFINYDNNFNCRTYYRSIEATQKGSRYPLHLLSMWMKSWNRRGEKTIVNQLHVKFETEFHLFQFISCDHVTFGTYNFIKLNENNKNEKKKNKKWILWNRVIRHNYDIIIYLEPFGKIDCLEWYINTCRDIVMSLNTQHWVCWNRSFLFKVCFFSVCIRNSIVNSIWTKWRF